MNLKEWCQVQGVECFRHSSSDMYSANVLQEAWDYQQNKIDKLKEDLKDREWQIEAMENDLKNLWRKVVALYKVQLKKLEDK